MPVSVCVAPLLPERKRGKLSFAHADPREGCQRVVYAVYGVEGIEVGRDSDVTLVLRCWGS